jgi:hypothetical protein
MRRTGAKKSGRHRPRPRYLTEVRRAARRKDLRNESIGETLDLHLQVAAAVIGVEINLDARFYEGVCQAPWNSDVQWFSELSPLDTVVVTSLAMIRLQVLVCR